MGATGPEHTDYSSGNTAVSENRGVKSDALSVETEILARSGVAIDPELVAICRLWPSLAADLRERIKAMIVEALTVTPAAASPSETS